MRANRVGGRTRATAVDADDAGGRRRRLVRQRAILLVSGQHGARVVLRLLHVGFVERVDAQGRSGHRGRELPAEELGAEVEQVGHLQCHDGMSRPSESTDGAIERGVVADAEGHEQAVVAVHGGITKWLGADGDDALALLACALGDELLGPERELGNTVGREDGHLVAPGSVEQSHRRAQCQAAVEVGGRARGARTAHVACAVEQGLDVDARDSGGYQPEEAQGRVAAADVRWILEHIPELALTRCGR